MEIEDFVLNALFIYAFNAFKSLGLLLPHLYFESAAAVLRQLWEVSLNLEWISRDARARSTAYANFTVMEYGRFIQKTQEPGAAAEFEAATGEFRRQYLTKNSKGKIVKSRNFSNKDIYYRAEELGDPWVREYSSLYDLASMNAHGAPGAVFQGMFHEYYGDAEARQESSAAFSACAAIILMVRNVQRMAQCGIIRDCSRVDEAYTIFESMLSSSARKG